MDPTSKFQLSKAEFGCGLIFSAIINFLSSFKRLDPCVKA